MQQQDWVFRLEAKLSIKIGILKCLKITVVMFVLMKLSKLVPNLIFTSCLMFSNLEQKMKTALLGAILLLVPNLLDACINKPKNCGEGPIALGISLGGLSPWNQFMYGGRRGRNLGDERKKNKGKKYNKKCMDSFEFVEILAFSICDEDGDNGLTWKEVSDCIVSRENVVFCCYNCLDLP